MTDPAETALDEVMAALKGGDLAGLGALVPRLEGALATADPARLARLQRRGAEVAACLAAAGRGLLAARQRLAELRRGGAVLRTYDRSGRRCDIAAPAMPARRF